MKKEPVYLVAFIFVFLLTVISYDTGYSKPLLSNKVTKNYSHTNEKSLILSPREENIIKETLSKYQVKTQKKDVYSAPKRKKHPQIEKSIMVKSFYKNSLAQITKKPTNSSVSLSVSNSEPDQGDSIKLIVKSNSKILKCFGNIGGKQINFLNVYKNYHFRSFVGFDIEYPPGKVKILVGILFENYEAKYLEREITVKQKIVTRSIRIYVYKKRWVTRRYKRNGKIYRKRVRIRYRVRKRITPPKNHKKTNTKTLIDFQKEFETQILANYQYGIGGDSDEKESNSKDNSPEKKNKTNIGERKFFNGYYNINTPQQFWQGPFLQPTYPKKGGKISKFAAYRIFPYKGRIRRGYHRGLDIAKPAGTSLYAPNHGIVVIAGPFTSRGKSVVIDHGSGIYSVHFHLSNIIVQKDMFVRKGQLIGYVGSTGISTGPHLHWEIRVNGTSVNPLQWKTPHLVK